MIVLVQFLHPWGSLATPTDIASSPVLCSIQPCAPLHMKGLAARALDSRSAQGAPTEAAIPVFWGSSACFWASELAVYGSTLRFLASCGAPRKAYYSRGGWGLMFPNFWLFLPILQNGGYRVFYPERGVSYSFIHKFGNKISNIFNLDLLKNRQNIARA